MVVVTPRVGQSVRAARQPATMQGLPRTLARGTQVVLLGSSTSKKQDPGTLIQVTMATELQGAYIEAMEQLSSIGQRPSQPTPSCSSPAKGGKEEGDRRMI
ncbi:hypothetical protein E2C01_074849 [Portunus trituberculatus]|uniref:Uncharacterized protein n=1 Tax=Portunus trituberculatus TaxID=210409 RepID=A0A5B7IDH1_PORTR|nr:hypothetical protein [Portunus trituberculatus]